MSEFVSQFTLLKEVVYNLGKYVELIDLNIEDSMHYLYRVVLPIGLHIGYEKLNTKVYT